MTMKVKQRWTEEVIVAWIDKCRVEICLRWEALVICSMRRERQVRGAKRTSALSCVTRRAIT